MNEELRVEEITLRVESISEDWSQYDLFSAPLLMFNPAKGEYEKIPKKLVFYDRNSPRLVNVLSRDYALYPNEELAKVVDAWADQNGYRLAKSGTSRSGFAQFRTYLPIREGEGEHVIVKGDAVKLGFSTRNSIDGTVGLGFDVFTFRRACSNGVIVGRENKAWFGHKHTVGMALLTTNVTRVMEELMDAGERVVAFYRVLPTIRLNQEIASALASTYLPKKYLPFELDKKKQPIRLGERDMWTVYNDITQAIWHNADTDMVTKYAYFNVTHSTLAKVIPLVRA